MFPFDCCDRAYVPGETVYNVGDSINVILYCSEHAPDWMKGGAY